MNDILKEKISEIGGYLTEIEEKAPDNLENYLKSRDAQLICERLFEITIEAIIDLVFVFINEKKMNMPEDDESALDLLTEKNIISLNLAKKLREARRMRNIVAHKYGRIDSSLVFNAIREELPRDIREFLHCIRRAL